MLITRCIALILLIIFSVSSLQAETTDEEGAGLNEATLKGLEWRSIGPAMRPGRVADIAVRPADKNTWYVGVGSGGVWKTNN